MQRYAVICLLLAIGLGGAAAQSLRDAKCGYFDELQMHRQDTFAVPTEHQWLARIIYSNDNNRVSLPTGGCQAVLISKRNLLAPAHCFYQYESKPEAYAVQLGVWNRSANVHEVSCRDGYCVLPAQEIRLSEIAIHPEFDPLTLKHSLAVLTLENDVKLSPNVMPVCMPPPAALNDTLVGQFYVVAGFPIKESLKNKSWVRTISRPWCQKEFGQLVTNSATVCGFMHRNEMYHLGSPLVGVHVEGETPKNFYLVGMQLEALQAGSRIVVSFQEVRPYLDFIKLNAVFD